MTIIEEIREKLRRRRTMARPVGVVLSPTQADELHEGLTAMVRDGAATYAGDKVVPVVDVWYLGMRVYISEFIEGPHLLYDFGDRYRVQS